MEWRRATRRRQGSMSRVEKSMRCLVRRMTENAKQIRPRTRPLRRPQRTHLRMQTLQSDQPTYRSKEGEMVEWRLATSRRAKRAQKSIKAARRRRPRTRPQPRRHQTRLWTQAHPASPACCLSGEKVKPRPAMLEPACTSPTEHRPASHEGETARRPQYATAQSQPGAPTTPTQTTGNGARTCTRKAEVGVERAVERAMSRAMERSREVDMRVDEVAATAR